MGVGVSLSPAILDALLASGASAETIVAAVKAAMAEDEARKAVKRGKDAQRQRDSRENRRSHTVSRDVTVTECDPPNDIYSNPPVNIPQPAKAGLPPKSKSSRAAVLPSDWQPVLTPTAQRIVDGWPPGRLETEVAKFRDYAADKGRTSKDWQAAFRTWLTNSEKWNPTNGTNRTASASIDRRDGFERAIDDWAGLDPFGNSRPASRAECGTACGTGGDGGGTVAGVITLRPDNVRSHHSDDARRIADARNG